MGGTHKTKIARQQKLVAAHGYNSVFDMLNDLYTIHKTVKASAKYLGISPTAYWEWMAEYGVEKRTRIFSHADIPNSAVCDLIASGHSYKEAAEMLGVSASFVHSVLNGHRKDPAKKELDSAAKNKDKCVICGKPRGINRQRCRQCCLEMSDLHNCGGDMLNAAYNL